MQDHPVPQVSILARATIVEVVAPPCSTTISCICIIGISFWFNLAPKQYGRAGGLNASLLYMAYKALIFAVTGADSGTETPVRGHASAFVMNEISVSLLPTLFRFPFEGSANLSMASNPKPHSSVLGLMSSSSPHLPMETGLLQGGYLLHQSPSYYLSLNRLFLSF